MVKSTQITSDENYIISAGTPFALALRQIIILDAETAISDEEIRSVLEPVLAMITSEGVGVYGSDCRRQDF